MSNLNPFQSEDTRSFARRLGPWTQRSGPDSDVALTSRIRLARNLDGIRFRTKIEHAEAEAVYGQVHAALESASMDGGATWVSIDSAPPVLRLLLRERYLCSRELAPAGERDDKLPGRAVAFAIDEDISIMINEEDHIRLSAVSSGFDLDGPHSRVCALDRRLEQQLDYAYRSDLGYLTGCPTNVGTGMRASVMLHLPALGLVPSELEKVIRASQRTGLAVRGIYGEGSRAVGDFYQISNQVTLGRTEEQLLGDLGNLVPSVIAFERRVRDELTASRPDELKEKLGEARDKVASVRSIATDEALQALSIMRLADLVGLEGATEMGDFAALVIQLQKGHVQVLGGDEDLSEVVGTSVRDELRAGILRRRFDI